MDPITGALISGGSSLLGGVMNNLWGGANTSAANSQNLGNAFLQAQWNLASQQQNQQWMEHMSNTAYQRGVADMKAAGLNPALMFGSGGPSSTPSSSPAQMSIPAQLVKPHGDVISPAVASALQAATVLQGLQKVAADTAQSQALTSEAGARTSAILAEIPGKERSGALAEAQIQASNATAQSARAAAAVSNQEAGYLTRYGVRDPGRAQSFLGGIGVDVARTLPKALSGGVDYLREKVSPALPPFSSLSPSPKRDRNPEYRNGRIGRPYREGDLSWSN